MVSPRVSRAVNPHRRKLTLKQIKAGFGGKRRLASLKANRHKHKPRRKAKAASNPKKHKRRATAKRKNAQKKIVYRTRYKTKTVTKKVYVKPKRKATAKRRKKNAQLLMTLAPLGYGPNPHRKRRTTSMAKHKRKASAKGRSGKRRNPTRRRSVAKRGRGPARHRNPGISSAAVKGIIGGAVAFSIGKKVPPLLGPTANSSPIMSLVSTALTVAATVWAAKRFAPAYADGALIGGGMAVLNVAWNAWAPASIAGYSALGDFAPATQPWLLPRGPVGYIADGSIPVADANVNMGAWQSAW